MTSASFLRLLTFATLFLLLAGTPGVAGSNPRDVALTHHDDGTGLRTILLTTSMSSDDVTQVDRDPQGAMVLRDPIGVGDPSWGVAFANPTTAVVTHPGVDHVSILQLCADYFAKVGEIDVPYYSTAVIPSPVAGRVFIANRGEVPPGAGAADGWMHAVYEVDVNTLAIERRFLTEREPRALAVSPNGERLFVGTAQGAMGGDGIISDTSSEFPWRFDGGSIVVYDLSRHVDWGRPVQRFPVGSPVRGLLTWPPPDAPPEVLLGTLQNGYRLYFTHVGDGAQSEAPAFGGRVIANAVSSLALNRHHRPVSGSRQDVVFRHDADFEPNDFETVSALLPAVLPESIAFRWIPDGSDYDWELWVSNSASGTVSRAQLDRDDGTVVVNGSVNLLAGLGDDEYRVITGRDANGRPLTVNATATNATVNFGLVDQPFHLRVDDIAGQSVPYSSNPRAVAFDPDNDLLYTVTRFDSKLVEIRPAPIHVEKLTLGPHVGSPDQRRFFTFGKGFDFREPATRLVNNLSCATCHVEAHIDGKVRHTVRSEENLSDIQLDPLDIPVAVPSVFDVGSTEWIFFEGLVTIRDHEEPDELDCVYCFEAQFFDDTRLFTEAVSSPRSPHAFNQALSPQQLAGRSRFEAMNCSRCHAGGGTPGFARTNEDLLPPGVSRDGPLPDSLQDPTALLHDPGQVFISSSFSNAEDNDALSLRNMTDVGTRLDTRTIVSGVNTPSLAGAWDNGPYLHDGRWRTLEEVLQHTWLEFDTSRDHYLAAPISSDNPPDNAFNQFSPVAPNTATPVPSIGNPNVPPLWEFQTHQTFIPNTGDWVAVSGHLDPAALDELTDFLRALSSQTDLCNGPVLALGVSSAVVRQGNDCIVTVNWTPSFPIETRYRWVSGSGDLPETWTYMPVEDSHTIELDVGLGTGRIQIRADSPLCPLVQADVTEEWVCGGGGPGGGHDKPKQN